mmetsp:Transcript_16809/g.38530  ORF Transcript_16809/g.38530 Transcript_16809/m.38530 type:complete len:114 (-) Transcript_16809:34-375(-)
MRQAIVSQHTFRINNRCSNSSSNRSERNMATITRRILKTNIPLYTKFISITVTTIPSHGQGALACFICCCSTHCMLEILCPPVCNDCGAKRGSVEEQCIVALLATPKLTRIQT